MLWLRVGYWSQIRRQQRKNGPLTIYSLNTSQPPPPSQPPVPNYLLLITYKLPTEKWIWSETEAKKLMRTKRKRTENMDREILFENSRSAQAQTSFASFRFNLRKKNSRNLRTLVVARVCGSADKSKGVVGGGGMLRWLYNGVGVDFFCLHLISTLRYLWVYIKGTQA